MYVTRQDLKVEIRYLHSQIRELVADFNGSIRTLNDDVIQLQTQVRELESIITNLRDFGK